MSQNPYSNSANPYQNTSTPYSHPLNNVSRPNIYSPQQNQHQQQAFPPPPTYYEANAQVPIEQAIPTFRYADASSPGFSSQPPPSIIPPSQHISLPATPLSSHHSMPSAPPAAANDHPAPPSAPHPLLTPSSSETQFNPFDLLVQDLSATLPGFFATETNPTTQPIQTTQASVQQVNSNSSTPQSQFNASPLKDRHVQPEARKPVDTTPDINFLLQTGQIIIPIDDFECDICCEYTCLQFFQQEIGTLGCFPGSLHEFQDQCPALQFSTCLHTFCLQCIREHISTYITTQLPQASIKRIPCLACDEWLTQNELRAIMPEAEYLSFEQRQFEWSLLNNKNMYRCITPNCANVIEKTGKLAADERSLEFNPKFICDSCHQAQCIKCLVPWHLNQSCREYRQKDIEKQALEGSSALRDAKAIIGDKKTIQECPNCKCMIEKVSGCDKVKCLCGYGFCWICGSVGANCKCTASSHIFFDNQTGRGTRNVLNP